jgi:hypothetical protein
VSSLAPARPRGGLFSRFHCSRSGHHWERQILDSGAEARWVCTTCGKLGDEIPVITPEQEVVDMSKASETPIEVEDVVDSEPELESTDAAEGPEVVSAEAADEESSASRVRPVLKIAIVTAASAVVIGGALFALRRRRR